MTGPAQETRGRAGLEVPAAPVRPSRAAEPQTGAEPSVSSTEPGAESQRSPDERAARSSFPFQVVLSSLKQEEKKGEEEERGSCPLVSANVPSRLVERKTSAFAPPSRGLGEVGGRHVRPPRRRGQEQNTTFAEVLH